MFFVDDYGTLKSTTLMEHHIDTGDAEPISFLSFHVSPVERERIKEEVVKIKEENVIKESVSPWSSVSY